MSFYITWECSYASCGLQVGKVVSGMKSMTVFQGPWRRNMNSDCVMTSWEISLRDF